MTRPAAGKPSQWKDVKDIHGAVLESHNLDGSHLIRPLWAQWECRSAETGHVIARHDQISVVKRMADELIAADRRRALR